MLSITQNVIIIAGSVALAVAFLMFLRVVWDPVDRREHNSVVGWHLGVLGTTYAVLMAFMLSGVWADFESAQTNVEVEANSLVNLFRISSGLPITQRRQIQILSRDYANLMITEEWPAMRRVSLSPAGFRTTQQLWETLLQTDARSLVEQTSLNQALAALAMITEHRRIRQLQSRSQLPVILWVVLIAGAVITVGTLCVFGITNLKLHTAQVITASFMVALVLVAIADIDQPFQGSVHVRPDGFEFARTTFDQLMSAQR